MGINGITNILRGMRSSRKAVNKQLLELCDTLSKTQKRTHSTRLPISGQDIQTYLPKPFQELVAGLKNPTVTVGYNAGKGQSVIGMSIKEGNKPIGGITFALDSTRGKKPMLQAKYRFQMPDASAEQVMSGSLTLNPNAPISDDFLNLTSKRKGIHHFEHAAGDSYHVSASFNTNRLEEFSRKTGLEMPNSEELAKMPETISGHSQRIMDKFLDAVKKPSKTKKAVKTRTSSKPKAVKAAAPTAPQRISFAEDAKKIMALEGKPSVESANKAKDLIMKRMGYDPSLVTVKADPNLGGTGGMFNIATGEIVLNPKYSELATHFDVTDVLVHELSHLDDAVKTAKVMGIDNFEKLIMARKGTEQITFNRKFYEEAIKQVDIKGFDAKPFIEHEKLLNKLHTEKYTDDYFDMLNKWQYSISPTEVLARKAELKLIADLKAQGVNIKSSMPLERFGKTPHEYLQELVPQIETKLAHLTPQARNEKFNETFYKILEEKNPEFASLWKKLNREGISDDECTRFDELEKTLSKNLSEQIYKSMPERL